MLLECCSSMHLLVNVIWVVCLFIFFGDLFFFLTYRRETHNSSVFACLRVVRIVYMPALQAWHAAFWAFLNTVKTKKGCVKTQMEVFVCKHVPLSPDYRVLFWSFQLTLLYSGICKLHTHCRAALSLSRFPQRSPVLIKCLEKDVVLKLLSTSH